MVRERLQSEPGNLMLVYGSSYLLSSLVQHEEAIAAARTTVEYVGKASRTLGRLGSAYAKAGNVAAAADVLREMEEIASRRYISAYHLALVNCSLGRNEA